MVHLYLEFPSPIEGRSEIDLKLPQTYGGQRVLTLGTTNGRLDIPLMARLCDNAILAIDRVSVRAEFAMDRLLDPLLLDEDYERRFKRMLRRNLVPISVAFARSNNYRGFDKLAETGFLNPETLTAVIDAVNDADEVEMTGYLLQMKRNRFGDTSLDFEL